jgi:hypothetical protein
MHIQYNTIQYNASLTLQSQYIQSIYPSQYIHHNQSQSSLELSNGDFYGIGNEGTIGFLRQSEIKHGRIAMFAFVGYCVQSNWIFPWPQHMDGSTGPSPDFSPEQQWDMIPAAAKWQIFGIIALLEIFDEAGGAGDGSGDHYTNTRQPGKFPTAQPFRDNVHFVLDLYDPFGFSKNKSAEKKARGLKAEINNGRLAMLGIFGFLTADKVPGSVPLLEKLGAVIPYSGETMAPFEANFHLFN